jgi:hypothetical protein
LCQRTYVKEENLPQKKDFVCRKLWNDEINKFGDINNTVEKVTQNLTKPGKKMIKTFILQHDKSEQKDRDEDERLYKYIHSKHPIKLNPWKFSNHVIEEFCRTPVDKVYSFSHLMEPTPKYMTKPFRRPKIYGDYFDNNI